MVTTSIATESLSGQKGSASFQKLADHSNCRFCGKKLEHTFVDLGMSPLCESYLSADQLNQMEPFYPLHVLVC